MVSPIVVAQLLDAGAGFPRRLQHAPAHLGSIVFVLRDRKHREQPVSHEFQDLSAMLADRRHLAVEIAIENVHHDFRRQSIGQRRETAQVRQPDHRTHRLGVAAADLAAENPLAGAVADIGIQQRRGLPAQADDLDDPCQRPHQRSQCIELPIAEATGLFCRPARGVHLADEPERQRDVVGNAFGAHVVEERKAPAGGIVEAKPHFPLGVVENGERAVPVFGRIPDIEIRGRHHHLASRPPEKATAENVGMQHANEDADAPERQSRLQRGVRRSPTSSGSGWSQTARRRSASPSPFAELKCSWRPHLRGNA